MQRSDDLESSCDKDDLASPLLSGNSSTDKCVPFYDENSVLDVPYHICRGYYILMTGGQLKVPEINKKRGFFIRSSSGPSSAQQRKTLNCDETISLDEGISFEISFDDLSDDLPDHLWIAWHALTDGNVIDSCFGIDARGGEPDIPWK